MPKGRPADEARLHEIAEAGARVFERVGYRRTRMADVARELGLSSGALYTYVSGKDALFLLVIEGPDAAVAAGVLPVPPPPSGAILAAVHDRLGRDMRTPRLSAARRRPAVDDPAAELTEVVSELYDLQARNRTLLAVVERSARDIPGLAEQYFRRGRRSYVDHLAGYLRRRIDGGAFRPVPDVAVTARYVIETIAWFASHRHDDADSAMIDDATARATVVDMAVAALVAPRKTP